MGEVFWRNQNGTVEAHYRFWNFRKQRWENDYPPDCTPISKAEFWEHMRSVESASSGVEYNITARP